jgi:regulator of protease activity HflC (stomatin/prohibitin superfamily)
MDIAAVFKFFALILWLVVGAFLLVIVFRSSRNQPVKGLISTMFIMMAVAGVVSIISLGLVFIQPEERGVVITASSPGYREEALQPGLRFIIPFVEHVQIYPISRQTYTMSAAANEGEVVGDDSIRARTKDGQEVFVDASVIYQVDPSKVVQLHIDWQDRYQDELIRPLSRGIIRDVVSLYGVEEIVSSKRGEMEQKITSELESKMGSNELLLSDFVLRDIHFSDEYAQAVEQKQIAEQQAQQAKYVVESKKQEAEQARQTAQGQADASVIAAKGSAEARLIQAEAEAKALKLIADVIQNNPSLLQYQYITKLSDKVNVMFLPSDAPFILPTNNFVPTPVP